jgi:NADPH-dependent F420 reductase
MVPVSVIGGSGDLGFGLALRLGHAGVAVTIGSRDAERAQDTAGRLRRRVPDGRFTGATNGDAADNAGIVVLTVPFHSQERILEEVRDRLVPGQILLDTTVPLASATGGRPTRTLGVWQGSAGQQVAELVPRGVGVVSALHTVAASELQNLDHDVEQDVLLCGDDADHKRTVAGVLQRIAGMRCIDCGRLEMSRYTEQIAPLLIGINLRYRAKSGVRIVGLPGELWA